MTPALTLVLAAALASPASPPPHVFLTYESGVLVGVNWVDAGRGGVMTRSVLNQSLILDARIELKADGSASGATSSVTDAGSAPGDPVVKSYPEGTVYWSDYIPSSVEQAILRARVLGGTAVRIPAASLYSAMRGEIVVERLDATDWTVTYHDKTYLALTDSSGALLSASVPQNGVVIERRAGFDPQRFAPWPPDSAPPDGAYDAREVRLRAPQGHTLAGTLSVPRGRGPFPAAVLITGLSPSNRNNGRPPWMPLRDISDALTRSGIAVLRVDDRGVGESTGDHAPSTTFDETDDVATEVAWLRARTEIDPERIALVGYSEGGLIAPMAAARDPRIAAIVTLAGPGVPGWEVARYQIEAAIVRDSSIAPAAREAEIQKALADSLTPREKSYLGIDPLEYARRVRCPALIVQGATDLHVPLRSAERIATAMRAAGNPDVTVRLLPGVSHGLMPDPVGLNSRWAMLPAVRTSPELLRTVADWASARLRAAPAPGSPR